MRFGYVTSGLILTSGALAILSSPLVCAFGWLSKFRFLDWEQRHKANERGEPILSALSDRDWVLWHAHLYYVEFSVALFLFGCVCAVPASVWLLTRKNAADEDAGFEPDR